MNVKFTIFKRVTRARTFAYFGNTDALPSGCVNDCAAFNNVSICRNVNFARTKPKHEPRWQERSVQIKRCAGNRLFGVYIRLSKYQGPNNTGNPINLSGACEFQVFSHQIPPVEIKILVLLFKKLRKSFFFLSPCTCRRDRFAVFVFSSLFYGDLKSIFIYAHKMPNLTIPLAFHFWFMPLKFSWKCWKLCWNNANSFETKTKWFHPKLN